MSQMQQPIAIMTPEQIEAFFERAAKNIQSSPLPPEIMELERLKRKMQLTPKEVEKLYGYSTGTLANWRSSGRGPEYIQEGDGPVFYEHTALKAYCDACRKKTYV